MAEGARGQGQGKRGSGRAGAARVGGDIGRPLDMVFHGVFHRDGEGVRGRDGKRGIGLDMP